MRNTPLTSGKKDGLRGVFLMLFPVFDQKGARAPDLTIFLCNCYVNAFYQTAICFSKKITSYLTLYFKEFGFAMRFIQRISLSDAIIELYSVFCGIMQYFVNFI